MTVSSPRKVRHNRHNRPYDSWTIGGELHRDDGPAFIGYRNSARTIIDRERYYQYGILHRDDGPAVVRYFRNGRIKQVRYYQYDMLHRDDGPAVINYTTAGQVRSELHHLHGVLVSEDASLDRNLAATALGLVQAA